jgi:hypothetical protein
MRASACHHARVGATGLLPYRTAEHRARIRVIKRIYLDELRAVLNAADAR